MKTGSAFSLFITPLFGLFVTRNPAYQFQDMVWLFFEPYSVFNGILVAHSMTLCYVVVCWMLPRALIRETLLMESIRGNVFFFPNCNLSF